jgi:DNA polymerase-1
MVNEKVKDVTSKKKAANETISEAWERIFSMNNTEKDTERLREVQSAMLNNEIKREHAFVGKKFSKAEALRLYKTLMESQREEKLAEMVKKTPANYILVKDNQTLDLLKQELEKAELASFDLETYGEEDIEDALDPWKGFIAGFSISTEDYNFYLPLRHTEKTSLNIGEGFEKLTEKRIIHHLKPYLEKTPFIFHNAPFDCKFMHVRFGIDMVKNLLADTRVMAFMLDETRSHRLKDLATDWLGIPSDNFDELFGKTPFNQIPLDVALCYAGKDTAITLSLYKWIMNWFNKREDLETLKNLTFDVEIPVLKEFIYADLRGIRFNSTEAKTLDLKLEQEEKQLEKDIYKALGKEINLSSPAQLSKVLFEELRVHNPDKGSTGVKTLKKIKSEHPSIPMILEFRELSKLRTSFTVKLPNEVKFDGKIHPSHNTLGAKTGRFTCKDPNTQQIPSKRDEIRKLFEADNGRILIGADLSQIELRVVSVMASEQTMIDAFNAGRDLHSTTASAASGIPYERIEQFKDTAGTPEWKWRKIAKTLNFGVLYGIGAKGLAEMLECTSAEAQVYIDNFFQGYPAIAQFMEDNKELIARNGYTTDMFGRKRRFHEQLKKANEYERYGIYRQGNNFPVQSSAGIVLKKAIVELQKVLPSIDAHILLQIHDELIFDVPETITKEQVLLIKSTIENCIRLSVPLKSDVEIYPKKWSEGVTIEEWFN